MLITKRYVTYLFNEVCLNITGTFEVPGGREVGKCQSSFKEYSRLIMSIKYVANALVLVI